MMLIFGLPKKTQPKYINGLGLKLAKFMGQPIRLQISEVILFGVILCHSSEVLWYICKVLRGSLPVPSRNTQQYTLSLTLSSFLAHKRASSLLYDII